MASSRTFRIFVSSTFSDFKEERKALQKKVFPKLRDLCEKNGCRFQAIDLRWGVSTEAAYDQQALHICLEEIARCQKVSPKPNFILLLGNRYGWRPLPSEIPASEYEKILEYIPNSDDKGLLEKWYRRDDNAVPPEYCLQPRVTEEDRDQETWDRIERALHTILKDAAIDARIPDKDFLKYSASATEQEIIRGVIKVPDAQDHVFGFFRNINDLPLDESARDFIDLDVNGKLDENGWEDSQRLKESVQNTLNEKNIKSYNATWTGNGITPDHIPKFCDDVQSSLEKVIRSQIVTLEKGDELENEIAEHDSFGKDRMKNFVGRENTLQIISEYLANENPHVLAISGESGSGKTAFMARVVQEAREKYPESVIVSRFIGATASSTNSTLLLKSLCTQICRRYSVNESSIPNDYERLVNKFRARLQLASPNKPLIVILDALDQLSVVELGNRLSWLPFTLPKDVKIIVSSIPGENHSLLEGVLPSSNINRIDPLVKQEGKELLDFWLHDENRTLQPWQKEELLTNFEKNGSPLYLKLAFKEACHWKSYTPDYKLNDTIPGIIEKNLLMRLSSEANHGPKIVSWCLGYLAASRYGLAEDELIDLISSPGTEVFQEFKKRSYSIDDDVQRLPVIVWSRFYFDLKPYFMERNVHGASLLTFYHHQLADTIENSLVCKNSKMLHGNIAEYFSNRSLDERKVDELPWQLEKAQEWERLKNCISDIRMFQTLASEAKKYELVKYWLSIGDRYDIEDTYSVMVENHIQDAKLSESGEAALLNQVGLVFSLTGHFPAAREFFSRSFKIREKVLGFEHPDTATSLNNLGSVLLDLGIQFGEPQRYIRPALNIREKLLGPEHPETIISRNSLVKALIFSGKFREANNLNKQSLRICEKVFGPEHIETAKCLDNGGKIIFIGRSGIVSGIRDIITIAMGLDNLKVVFSENESMLRRSLRIKEKSLGPEHPETAQTISILVPFLSGSCRSSEAELLTLRALSINEGVLGSDHPAVEGDLIMLAALHVFSGRLYEGELAGRRALAICEKVHGPGATYQGFHLIGIELTILAQWKFGESIRFFIHWAKVFIKTNFIDGDPSARNQRKNLQKNRISVIGKFILSIILMIFTIIMLAGAIVPILFIATLTIITFIKKEFFLLVNGRFHDAVHLFRWPLRVFFVDG